MAKTTKIDQVVFVGSSGRRYEYRVYVWDTKFKSVPGVYVVASRTMDPGQPAHYEALFVGEATDLSAALKSHPRQECFTMYYANVIGVLKEENAKTRAAIVADLLASLALPCNAADAV